MAADVRGELDARYGFRNDMSIYARWGDWLPEICALVSLILMLFAWRRRCRSRSWAFCSTHCGIAGSRRAHGPLFAAGRFQFSIQARYRVGSLSRLWTAAA